MPVVEAVDVEGAVRVYVNTYPGLTGDGNPLANGVHIGKARSPARGAIAELEAIGPRALTDISDDARVTFRVHAVGSERGAREVAEYAARKLAEAVLALSGAQVAVQTRQGEWVRLIVAGRSAGPTFTGDVNGRCTYTFDATFVCQAVSSDSPLYGAGLYGAGLYGS
jgi:hypothetical protein